MNIIWVSVDSGDGQKLRHLISNRFEEGAELFHQKNKVRYKIMFVYFVLHFCSIISYLLLVKVNISKIIKCVLQWHCTLNAVTLPTYYFENCSKSCLLLLLLLADIKWMLILQLLNWAGILYLYTIN